MFTLRRLAVKAGSLQFGAAFPHSRSIVSITSRATIQTRKQWAPAAFQMRFASEQTAQSSEAERADESVSATESSTAAEVNDAKAQDAAMPDLAAKPDEGIAVKSVGRNRGQSGEGSAPSTTRSSARFNISESQSTVYVGNLFFEVTADQVKERFTEFGPVKNVHIAYDPRGLSKGFGYVVFEKREDAQSAIEAANQVTFHGRRMVVQEHKQRQRVSTRGAQPPQEPSKTLFIGNMSYEMSDKDLNDLFRQVKGVVDVRVQIDRNTGQPRGFAHADFTSVEAATEARDYLRTKEFYGRQLRVDYTAFVAGGRRASST